MKSILFVIPWSGFYIGTNYSFSEAPERAPEGIVGLATYLQAKLHVSSMPVTYSLLYAKLMTAIRGKSLLL